MKHLIIIILFGCLFSVGCNPKYYSPNTQNVPLISEKGETNLTLSGSGNQAEFQVAYGLSGNFAFQANGGLFLPPDLDNGNGGSGNFFELGGGYFKPVGEKFVFETYGIVGFGSMENHLPSTVTASPQTKGDISAKILRFGIQPNFGYKSKSFSAAISSRIVSLNYNSVEGDLIFDGVNQINYLEENKSNFLIEPALTIKFGLEKVKLQFQYGLSMNVSKSNFTQDKTYATLGLNFNFR